MEKRTVLQTRLEALPGVKMVRFQPGVNITLQYPCVVYEKALIFSEHADNEKYRRLNRYTVTVMDRDPDSELPDLVHTGFQYCLPDRFFTIDNLYHWTFTLYF